MWLRQKHILFANRLPAAANAHEQLLTDQVRLLGPDHPNILTTRHNLTYWRRRANSR
jgi:hypothetical protein